MRVWWQAETDVVLARAWVAIIQARSTDMRLELSILLSGQVARRVAIAARRVAIVYYKTRKTTTDVYSNLRGRSPPTEN